jgi:integrase
MPRGKAGTFGSTDQLPSGRYRAMYYGPDGRRYKAPATFTNQREARAWLALRQSEIIRKAWEPPEARAAAPAPKLTLAAYANRWHAHRDLKPRTREHYRKLLDRLILPTLGNLPIASMTADDVRDWYAQLDRDTPTQRSHAYGLLRTICGDAVRDGKAQANPCVLRGAGSAKRVHVIRPATVDELAKITDAMPDRLKLMVILGAWCAMRFGEITELRRGDIDLEDGVVRIRRAVVRVNGGQFKVGPPKTDAGIRDVAVPPHLLPALRDHLVGNVDAGKDSLLFSADHGGHLAPSTFDRWWRKARAVASRDDLRFHDLRHSGAVLAAQTGATIAELMGRLGHSTPAAAMRYQHAAAGADQRIAERLSKLAGL